MSIPNTITDQIERIEELEISYRVLVESSELIDENSEEIIEIPFHSLIDEYHDFFEPLIMSVKLPDELQQRYRYNPKMVSKDLYGTTELWHEILILNNCASIIDFKPTTLNVYAVDDLKEMINEMLILEEKY